MKEKGFTLVELLVSVSIMLLIAVIAIPNITGSIAKNKQKEKQSYLDQFVAGAKLYMSDHESGIDNCTGFPKNIYLKTLVDGEYIKDELPTNPETNEVFDENSFVIVNCSDGTLSYDSSNIE